MGGAAAGAEAKRFGRSAGLLSAGIGAAGALTYVYFALASHNLAAAEYGEVVVLWSATFIAISVLYRPVEQLLSRTIAEREVLARPLGPALRVAAAIQLAIAAAWLALALALRGPIESDLLSGDATLYWVLVGAVLAFGASFFARGFLAGRHRFGVLAALLLAESAARAGFALALAVGLAEGQDVVALGIVAAPCLSLLVVPLAAGRVAKRRASAGENLEPLTAPGAGQDLSAEFSLAEGGGFAAAVLVIMVSEQALLNAGPLLVRASLDAAAAGFIFNVLMVARAPLVVFQGIAISLLPHLTRLISRGGDHPESADAFRVSVRATLLAVAAFTAVVEGVVLAAGPELMQIAFGETFSYDRLGLVIVAAGMGFYLAAATLNQAALARGRARAAAACWIACAVAFLAWNLIPGVEELRRVETGFTGAAALLCGLLYLLYRRGAAEAGDAAPQRAPAAAATRR